MRFPISWIKEFVSLPEDTKTLSKRFTLSGTEVEEILEAEGETIFDFNFTVNRPDLMSIYGLARESAALFDISSPKYLPTPYKSQLKIEDEISIEVLDKDLCPRYRAYVIKGAKVGHSTPLIQKRLTQCGLRPINAVVDATNYVLLEYGHPLHAFDLKFIKGKKIIVRRAREGEKLKLLDGSEKKLLKDMLIIADSERPLAVAGVMGGEESGVSFLTRDILLEGAVFNPVSIRRTSKALNIHTDSSHRFERGCDYEGVVKALDRVAELILEMCGGQLCEKPIDIKTDNKKINKIELRIPRIKKILGLEIPKEDIVRILDKLEFKVEENSEDILRISVPTFRVDVEREIDIIEEIIRIYGLDKLPVSIPEIIDIESGRNESQISENRIRHLLSQKSLFEAVSFSITDPSIDSYFCSRGQQIKLTNPLSESNSVLRRSLLSNLFLNAKRNASYGSKSFGFFELGKVYFKLNKNEAQDFNEGDLQDFFLCKDGSMVVEEPHLAMLLYEEDSLKLFHQFFPRDIFQLKGIVEGLFDSLHKKCSFLEKKPFSEMFSENHFVAILCDGIESGFIAYLEPKKIRDFGLEGKVCVAEIVIDSLSKRKDPSFKPFSRYPASRRDLSVIVENDVRWISIQETILKSKPEHLSKLELLEVYQDEKIGKKKKSVTIAFYFQSTEKTLSESEIEKDFYKITETLKSNFNAVLR